MFSKQSVPLDNALEKDFFPQLETFESPFDPEQDSKGIVRIIFPEFTCVCPKTGYPDFGTIGLYYIPDKLCIELKSWKLYLNSFRMVGTFHETVTVHLFDTIRDLLKPVWLLMVGDFFPRGNVDTTVILESKGPRPESANALIAHHKPLCKQFDKAEN